MAVIRARAQPSAKVYRIAFVNTSVPVAKAILWSIGILARGGLSIPNSPATWFAAIQT
jgi:hypothetical protein